MLEESTKRWSKPLGLACATFLSSWPGVLRQLRCVHKKTWHRRLQIRKQAPQSKLRELHPKGSLRLLCAGDAENANQSGDFPLSTIGAVAMRPALGSYLHEKRSLISRSNSFFRGDGRTRTAVQTPHQRAFYTLSPALVFDQRLPPDRLPKAYPLNLSGH